MEIFEIEQHINDKSKLDVVSEILEPFYSDCITEELLIKRRESLEKLSEMGELRLVKELQEDGND